MQWLSMTVKQAYPYVHIRTVPGADQGKLTVCDVCLVGQRHRCIVPRAGFEWKSKQLSQLRVVCGSFKRKSAWQQKHAV